MTSLATGEQISKGDLRIEAYGTVDELNAFCGLLNDALRENPSLFAELTAELDLIQNELFDLGGELSMPQAAIDYSRQQTITTASIERIEQSGARLNSKLPALANFVIPGGSSVNSLAHCVRTICRRAERCTVRLSDQTVVRPEIIIYLNRLSDWFFLAGRTISSKLGLAERQWQQSKKL